MLTDSTTPRLCSIPECDVARRARGFCVHHYYLARKDGLQLLTPEERRHNPVDLEERFFSFVDLTGPRFQGAPCFLWTGTKNDKGYGRFYISPSASPMAHRWIYEQVKGAIPLGLQLDHLCRTRHCVNVNHLEVVTPKENVGRGLRGRLKRYCSKGHPYVQENIRIMNGWRACNICYPARKEKTMAMVRTLMLRLAPWAVMLTFVAVALD